MGRRVGGGAKGKGRKEPWGTGEEEEEEGEEEEEEGEEQAEEEQLMQRLWGLRM